MTKFSKNLAIIVSLALVAVFAAVPAHSKSFLDSINDALDSADKALDKAQKDVNKALDSVNDGLRTASETISNVPAIATPPIVPENLENAASGQVNKAVESVNNSINKTLGDADKTVNKTAADVNNSINKALGDVDKTVNKTVNDVSKTFNQVNNTIAGIEKTLNKATTSIAKTGNDKIDKTVNKTVNTANNTINTITNILKPVQKELPTSDAITQKALEITAATGDAWAKLKLVEINAKKKAEDANDKYKSISWSDMFNKIKALSASKDSQKEYAAASEKLLEYEKNNPEAGKFIKGMDQINENLLQLKSMFGDKKAKAQLEMARAKRELDAFRLKYDAAGFFEKFKLRKELAAKKEAYEKALAAFKAAGGNAILTRKPNANQTGRIAENSGQSQNSDIQTTVQNVSDQVTTVISETTTVINNTTGDVKALREKVSAAYQKYIKQLESEDLNSKTLDKLQKEYTDVLNEYKKAVGGK